MMMMMMKKVCYKVSLCEKLSVTKL